MAEPVRGPRRAGSGAPAGPERPRLLREGPGPAHSSARDPTRAAERSGESSRSSRPSSAAPPTRPARSNPRLAEVGGRRDVSPRGSRPQTPLGRPSFPLALDSANGVQRTSVSGGSRTGTPTQRPHRRSRVCERGGRHAAKSARVSESRGPPDSSGDAAERGPSSLVVRPWGPCPP